MQVARPAGRQAASQKYDILSALMAFALAGDKTRQRRVLRLMALITTRYNWQRDELSLGQREIARLWAVDTRTVKREMATLRAQGWLVLKRQGARGRVSLYGLDLGRMMADTAPHWPAIGADFEARLAGAPAVETNVVPLRPAPSPPVGDGVWARAQALLHEGGGAEYAAWLHPLVELSAGEGRLVLAAPSRFHARYVETHLLDRVRGAVRRVAPSLTDVRVETGG